MAVTWNPADKSVDVTLSNGDLTATNGSSSDWRGVRATGSKSSGKWYCEFTVGHQYSYFRLGLATASESLGFVGNSIYGYSYLETGSKKHSNVTLAYGDSYIEADIISMAFDLDNGKIWWAKNGVWQASGDPAAGTNEAYSGLSGTFFPQVSFWGNLNAVTANFGASAFSYAVPSGFTALDDTEIFYPAASGDDGFGELPAGGFVTGSSSLYVGDFSGTIYNVFVRFPSINIPQGATITSAFVRFFCQTSTSGVTCNLNCYFNAEDIAVAPTNISEFNTLSLTTAIAWNNLEAWVDDTQYDTPSLVSILQDIIDRVGWSSNNAVQIIIKDNSSSASAYREPSAWDSAAQGERAELHVTWDEPAISGEISEDINILSEFTNNLGEIDENVSVLSEFGNNRGEIDENVSVNSEFSVLIPREISENISVNSEFDFSTPYIIKENVSVNSEFIGSYLKELSEGASVNSEFISEYLGELAENVSVNTEFIGYQQPGNIDVTLPMITADILGGTGGFLNTTLPCITAEIRGGALLEVTLPVVTADIVGKTGAVGNIDVRLPVITASIAGKAETLGQIDAILPAIRAYITGKTGKAGSINTTLPIIVANIQGYNDLTSSLDTTLPMLKPYLVGTVARFTSCAVILRYDDKPDILGSMAVEIPMIEASIVEA